MNLHPARHEKFLAQQTRRHGTIGIIARIGIALLIGALLGIMFGASW